VDRRAVEPGVIALSDGTDSVSIIVGEGTIDTIEVVTAGAMGDSLLWLVTDENGEVLEINSGPPFTFEDSGAGVCLIWQMSAAFDPAVSVGDLASELAGCFVLSNPITVTKTEPMPVLNGGDLSVDVNQICLGQDSLVVTTLTGAVGDTSTYIITDDAGMILEILPTFGAATPSGVCNVYHMSSNGVVTGLTMGAALADLSGDFDLSAAVAIDRQAVDGGILLTSTGVDSLTIIVGDATIDSIEVDLTGAVGDSLIWLVTDSNGIVLEVNTGPPFIFEGAGAGTCLIWNLSTNFGADVSVGDDATTLTGCFDLSNAITVVREEETISGVNGGDLTTVDGSTMIDICISTGSNTVIDSLVLTGAVGDTSIYVITEPSGFILSTFQNPPFNFGNTQAGLCQIWHVSYNGMVMGLNPGDNLMMATGDLDISNAIQLDRDLPVGGSLTLLDSTQNVTVTVGDAMIDLVDVVLTGAEGDETSWIITDTLGNIISLPMDDPFDFTNAAPGTCLIWNLSYSTGLTGLAVDNNVSQLEGCFALSNSIEVTKEAATNAPVGGTLTSLDGTTSLDLCLNSSMITIELMLTGNQGMNSDFVLVSSSGTILSISGTSTLNIDFGGSTPLGDCQAYHVSSDSTLMGLINGQPLSGLTGNFDLSNPVELVKVENAPGILFFENNNLGPDTITVGDGVLDTLNLSLSGTAGDSSVFVLVDSADMILDIQTDPSLEIDDNSAPGTCTVRSLTFSEGLEGLAVGNDINLDLVGCWATSNILILVKEGITNNTLVPGVISAIGGGDSLDVCVGANGGIIDLTLVGGVGAESNWMVTDDSGMIISSPQLMLPTTFISANPPSCNFYHIVHDGTLSGLFFGSHLDSLDGNFMLSNSVAVTKSTVAGNDIMFSDSTTVIDIMVGDGEPDTLNVISSAISTDTSVYVILNSNGVIQSVQDNGEFIFGSQISSTCTIYEVSYDTGFAGVSAGEVLGSIEGCFAISNALTVNKISVINVEGGVVTTPDGNNISICRTDMVSDSIFASVTAAIGSNMAWIITDESEL